MKAGKVVLFPIFIIAALCIAAIIGGLIFAMRSPTPESIGKKLLFDISSIDELAEMGIKPDLSGNYMMNDARSFGYNGVAEFKVKDENIKSVTFDVVLMESDPIRITEAEDSVKSFISALSEQNGFPIVDTPKKLQFADDETFKNCPKHEYEALTKGYVLFEYSYRDTEGSLWIVQIYSPKDNMLSATVIKNLDTSGYVDFEPQINLHKEVME